MVTLDMTDKDRPVAVKEDLFSTETGILTLQISLGTYDLTGKTVTAVFSETGVETGVLTVTAGIIQLPIVAGYVERGTNNIQLNIRFGLTLEQSPIMVWQILQPVSATDPSDSDVDVITWLLNSAIDSKNAADAVVASFEEDLGEGHELQADLQASIATGTPLLSDLQDANSTAGGLLTDLTTPSTGAIDVATAIEATLTNTTIPAAQSIEQTLRETTTPAATSINGTLANTTTPAAVAIEQALRVTTTPAAVAIEKTLRETTTPAATSINSTLTITTIPLANSTKAALELAIANGSVDNINEKVGTLQGEIEGIEDTILQMNPNGDAKITVTSFDTVNALPKNAAQAGLGVVQEGMTASNLVINGEGTTLTGWTVGSGSVSVVSGYFRVTLSLSSAPLTQTVNLIQDHKYYVVITHKDVSGTTGSLGIDLKSGASRISDTFILVPISAVDKKTSVILTATAPGNGLSLFRASTGDRVIDVKSIELTDLTAIAKQAATLSQVDAMLLDYFSGTQSAVTGRVRSVGKNLFDGQLESGTLDAGGINAVDATKIRSKNYTKGKPSTAYIFSNGSSYTALTACFYDRNRVFISQSAVNYATFTTPALTHFIRFQTTGTNVSANIQLELGTTATTFIAHAKTESYTKPMPLRRLPNNTLDDVTNGKHTKRVSEWANVAGASFDSIDNATYTNVSVVKTTAFALATAGTTAIDNSIIYRDKNGVVLSEVAQADIDNVASIGKFYYHTDKTVWRILAKGSLDIATARTNLGTETILYQLLTPVITENVSSGTLLAYPSGTVYWEPVIADVAIYATGASILNTGYPISTLESIYKIDLVTGEQTPLAVASATVAGNGLSFTHTGLSNGDLVGFTYYFAHALPYGENDYIYYDSRETAIDTVTAKVYRWRPVVTNGAIASWALTEVV